MGCGDVSAAIPIVTRAIAGRHQRAPQSGDKGAARFEYLLEAASLFSKMERTNSGESDVCDEETTLLLDHVRNRARRPPRMIRRPSRIIHRPTHMRPDLDDYTPQDDHRKSAQAKLHAALNNAPLLHSRDMLKAFPSQATNRIQRISRSLFSLIVYNQRSGQDYSLEPNLRVQLGDSPDTSKALRLLVSVGLVQRDGRGGRSDTFRYKVNDSQWARLELGTAAFVSPLSLAATTNLPASTSENVTAATATELILALPVVDSLSAATAEFNASLAGSKARQLCAPEVTPLQDLLNIPNLGTGSCSFSLTQPAAVSGGGRGSGTVYSQGSVILCNTKNNARPVHRNVMPPAKSMRTSASMVKAARARSSGESGAQGSHAPAESEREQGMHSILLKALPRSWGQENAHSFSSQASILHLAMATPQFPPPLFLTPSQAPSRSVGTSITNLTTNSEAPLSSSFLPLSTAMLMPHAPALQEVGVLHNMRQEQQQHHDFMLYGSTKSTMTLQRPLPSGEGLYQPRPGPTSADLFPFATSRKAALLERGCSDSTHFSTPEQ